MLFVQATIPSRTSGRRQRIDHPIAVVVDLCLHRVVTDRCRGHVLQFGVRQTVKDYAWVSFDNETLRAAVQLWCRNRATAYGRYGDINDWDVRNVTSMEAMFYYALRQGFGHLGCGSGFQYARHVLRSLILQSAT
jgi:hypothetical protein